MSYVLVGGIAVVIVAVGTIAWLSSVSRTESRRPSGSEAMQSLEIAAVAEDESENVARTKLAITGLLSILARSVDHIIDSSGAYDARLEGHRSSINDAMTSASIRKLETVILGELDALQQSNNAYRRELADARAQIEEQREQLERLEIDVGVDFLTGLPNRRSFDERLRENIDRSIRYKTPFSLVVFDIDHFKSVNDTYGHMGGDKVLRVLANFLSELIRSSDFLGRFGGEEFALILPETHVAQALQFAEKAVQQVEELPIEYNQQTIRVTISAGVGEVQQPEDTSEDLFNRVDAALYKAKNGGRNRALAAS